jgi:DNA invertase Pin-like site-specific DNA recombinase
MVTDKLEFVLYLRVSTSKQGSSGLGVEAQKRDIDLYLNNYVSSPYSIIEEFTEVETGKANDRPVLAKAIELAKSNSATLLVAKLDRLSRRVSFIAQLLEDKKLDFKVACMPNADKFQLHIYSALAEQERDFISKRTKAALAVAKERGVKLGGLRDKTGKRNKVIKEQAKARAIKLKGVIQPLRQQGLSMQRIADELNQLGYQTARGGKFTAMQVKRSIDRF